MQKEQEKEKMFSCIRCTKWFTKYVEYLDHNRMHYEQDTFKCYLCDTSFQDKTKLFDHARFHAYAVTTPTCQIISCEICSMRFSYAQFTSHMRRHDLDARIVCDGCDAKLKTESCLQVHKLYCHVIKSTGAYCCIQCTTPCIDYRAFIKHWRIHYDEAEFQCVNCDEGFKNKADLVEHDIFHVCGNFLNPRKRKTVKCEICNNNFFVDQFTSHMRRHNYRSTIPCTICNYKLKTANALEVHMAFCHVEKQYACHVCSLSFSNETLFTKHIVVHRNLFPTQCLHCSNFFPSYNALKIHVSKMHTLFLKCDICYKKFQRPLDLRTHVAIHHDAGHVCMICHRIYNQERFYREHMETHFFRDLTQLKVHQRRHTGEKPYSCHVCSKKFSINGNLKKHLITHTGERRFECDTCDKKFAQFAHLEDHMKIHSGDKPFQCEQCDTAFKTKSRLRKHTKSHDTSNAIKRKNIHCEICNKRFTFFQLEAHMRRHKDVDRILKCTQCDLQLKTYNGLQNHMKNDHADYKNFTCHICSKRFSTSTHLTRHVKTHSGIKPYICDICMRGFPCMQNLKRHIQVHRGEKPYQCETCQKAFLTSENLKRHVRTHTKEKPYSCTICGKRFSHTTTVKEHMQVHTGEKPFGCGVCNKVFSLNKLLYRHIRERHAEQLRQVQDIKEITTRVPAPAFVDIKSEIKDEFSGNEQEYS